MINPEMHSGGGSRSSSDIESDIRRTRGRMDATLDELSERLTARSVIHTLLDIWEARKPSTPEGELRSKRVYGALSRQVARQVQENPIPTLLIGAGLAWMFLDREREIDDRQYVEMSGRRYRVRPSHPSGVTGTAPGVPVSELEYEEVEYDVIDEGPGFIDRAKQKLAHGKEAISNAAAAAKDRIVGAGEAARERAANLGEAARERVGEFGDATRERASGLEETAHEAADSVRRRARQAYYQSRSKGRAVGQRMHSGYDTGVEKFSDAVNDYPLGVGIGFAALGALVGLLLPHTRREDELLGERSDELLHMVKERSKETLERGKAVVERVAETALDEAQKQGLTPQAAGEKLSELASKAGEIARKAKEEAVTAAEEQNLTPQQLKSEVSSSTFTTSTSSQNVNEGQSVNMPPSSSSTTGGF